MSNFKKIKFIVFLFLLQFILIPNVFAGTIVTTDLDKQDSALMGNSTLAGNTDLTIIISILIKSILGFLGIIFLVLTILAGFKWMTSQGNEDEIKKAQGSLKNAIIGLIIVLAAYAITSSVFTYLPFASNGSGAGGVTHTP